MAKDAGDGFAYFCAHSAVGGKFGMVVSQFKDNLLGPAVRRSLLELPGGRSLLCSNMVFMPGGLLYVTGETSGGEIALFIIKTGSWTMTAAQLYPLPGDSQPNTSPVITPQPLGAPALAWISNGTLQLYAAQGLAGKLVTTTGDPLSPTNFPATTAGYAETTGLTLNSANGVSTIDGTPAVLVTGTSPFSDVFTGIYDNWESTKAYVAQISLPGADSALGVRWVTDADSRDISVDLLGALGFAPRIADLVDSSLMCAFPLPPYYDDNSTYAIEWSLSIVTDANNDEETMNTVSVGLSATPFNSTDLPLLLVTGGMMDVSSLVAFAVGTIRGGHLDDYRLSNPSNPPLTSGSACFFAIYGSPPFSYNPDHFDLLATHVFGGLDGNTVCLAARLGSVQEGITYPPFWVAGYTNATALDGLVTGSGPGLPPAYFAYQFEMVPFGDTVDLPDTLFWNSTVVVRIHNLWDYTYPTPLVLVVDADASGYREPCRNVQWLTFESDNSVASLSCDTPWFNPDVSNVYLDISDNGPLAAASLMAPITNETLGDSGTFTTGLNTTLPQTALPQPTFPVPLGPVSGPGPFPAPVPGKSSPAAPVQATTVLVGSNLPVMFIAIPAAALVFALIIAIAVVWRKRRSSTSLEKTIKEYNSPRSSSQSTTMFARKMHAGVADLGTSQNALISSYMLSQRPSSHNLATRILRADDSRGLGSSEERESQNGSSSDLRPSTN